MTDSLFQAVLAAAAGAAPIAVTATPPEADLDMCFTRDNMSNPAGDDDVPWTRVTPDTIVDLTLDSIAEIYKDSLENLETGTSSMFGPTDGWHHHLPDVVARYLMFRLLRQIFSDVAKNVDMFISTSGPYHLLPLNSLRSSQIKSIELFQGLVEAITEGAQSDLPEDTKAQKAALGGLISALMWGMTARPVLVVPSLNYLALLYARQLKTPNKGASIFEFKYRPPRDLGLNAYTQSLANFPPAISTDLSDLIATCPEIPGGMLRRVFRDAIDTFFHRLDSMLSRNGSVLLFLKAVDGQMTKPTVKNLYSKVFGVTIQ